MERLITAVNSMLGTVLVLVALSFPFLRDGLIAEVRHTKVEGVVRLIAEEERSFYRSRSRFFNFALGDTSVGFPNKTVELVSATRDTGFEYEAFGDFDGNLVVRAHPTRKELLEAWSSPQVLTFRTHPKRNEEKLEWSNSGQ